MVYALDNCLVNASQLSKNIESTRKPFQYIVPKAISEV